MSNLMRPLGDRDLSLLRDSLTAHGYVGAPIIVDENGKILDGHHRQQLGEELGIEVPRQVVADLSPLDKELLSVRLNLARRHLSSAEKDALAAQLAERITALTNSESKPKIPQRQVAKQVAEVLNEPAKTTAARIRRVEKARERAAESANVAQFNPPANEVTFARHAEAAAKRTSTLEESEPFYDGKATRYWKRYENLIESAAAAGCEDIAAALDNGSIKLDEAEAQLRRRTGKIVDSNYRLTDAEAYQERERRAEAARLWVAIHQLPGKIAANHATLLALSDDPVDRREAAAQAIASLTDLLNDLEGTQ